MLPRLQEPFIQLLGLLFRDSAATIKLGYSCLDLGYLPFIQLDIGGNGFRREVGSRSLGAARQGFEPCFEAAIKPYRHNCGIGCAH